MGCDCITSLSLPFYLLYVSAIANFMVTHILMHVSNKVEKGTIK